MLHSPRLFRRKPLLVQDPSALVIQLFEFSGTDKLMTQLIKKQDGIVLRQTLSLITYELLDIKSRIDDFYILAYKAYPMVKEIAVHNMLMACLNKNRYAEIIPEQLGLRGEGLELLKLLKLTKMLSILLEMSDRFIRAGNCIHQELIHLGCTHTIDSLFHISTS